MKPTKVRNQQIYRASLTTRSNQLGCHLSKDLRQKYGKRSIRVIKGDTVNVIRGEYKDVEGKVAKISIVDNSIAIEGIKKEKGKGDKFDVLIQTSNVIVTSLNTGDSWRMAKLEGKQPKSNLKSKKDQKQKEEPKKTEEKITKPKKEIKEPKKKKLTEKKQTTSKVKSEK